MSYGNSRTCYYFSYMQKQPDNISAQPMEQPMDQQPLQPPTPPPAQPPAPPPTQPTIQSRKKHPVIAVVLTILIVIVSAFMFLINTYRSPYSYESVTYIQGAETIVTLEIDPGKYAIVYKWDTSLDKRPSSYDMICYIYESDGSSVEVKPMSTPLAGFILDGLMGRYSYFWIIGEFTTQQANPTISCVGDLDMPSNVRIFPVEKLKTWKYLSSPFYIIGVILATLMAIALVWVWLVCVKNKTTMYARNIMIGAIVVITAVNVVMSI